MRKTVIGYGVFKSQHKGTTRWLTGPVLEGDSVARFIEVWYGPKAQESAVEWAIQKTAAEEIGLARAA